MPNLTVVLNDEDKGTVEEIAKGVCLPLNGGILTGDVKLLATNYFEYEVTDTETSGFKWVGPSGTWTSHAINNNGYVLDFDGNVMFEIWENGGRLSNRESGLFWDNNQALISAPIAGADAITNIMELTQTEYDGITPDDQTLYVINGA